jgi:hypothetical protein
MIIPQRTDDNLQRNKKEMIKFLRKIISKLQKLIFF